MKYLILKPTERSAQLQEHNSMELAITAAGLKNGDTDHASLGAGVGMMVFEFGLFKDPKTTSYFLFKVGNGPYNLYEGPAVLYAYDPLGETVDFALPLPPVVFMTGDEAVKAVDAGIIQRPIMTTDGQEIWRWPNPNPMAAPTQ